jgi:hypothetical protein
LREQQRRGEPAEADGGDEIEVDHVGEVGQQLILQRTGVTRCPRC